MNPVKQVVATVDACLPQLQCARCGYAACRPYAEAIVDGRADINCCPPGGRSTIEALAGLLHVAEKPLDPDCGVEREPQVAVVDEQWCIGCTICIQACPVDAIIGAAKQMHVVIQNDCTGCELCIDPCPVDCIRLVPATVVHDECRDGEWRAPEGVEASVHIERWGDAWTIEQAKRARQHHDRRQRRLAQRRHVRVRETNPDRQIERKRTSIAQAVERVHRRRNVMTVAGHE